MKRQFTSLSQVYGHGFDTVIDVRSPAEFAEDHWPGAISLPVLDNAERARVGTIYKQESAFQAKVIGAALVAQNAARHLQGPLADMPGGWRPLVYCWRGGQRSGSFASILAQIGWRVGLVEGGYKTYRALVVEALHERPLAHRFVVVDGNTGTAKTRVLALLAERGAQVVDLEGLARHRGSLFGGVAGGQPSQKAFESELAQALHGLDPARPVVVEAESSKIGGLIVPPSVWAAMKDAPRMTIEAPPVARADYLVGAYADIVADRGELERVLASLVPLQGHDKVDRWLKMAATGEFRTLAGELMVDHYDPRYARSRGAHPEPVARYWSDDLGPEALERLADRIFAGIAGADAAR